MRIKGLVWLGIPAGDYAAADRFFTQILGLAVAFDEAGTMELSAETDDRIQLFGPGHRYFEFYRSRGASIVPLFEWTTSTGHATSWPGEEPRSLVSRNRMGFGPG